jgi:hypothetical protein
MDYYNADIMSAEGYLNNFSKRFKAPLVDRTGIMSDEIKAITKLPEDQREQDTKFNRIANTRAKIILARADKEKRDLRVSYSGGIDSTVALIALIKNKGKHPSVKITVVMSKESLKEYPLFYSKFIRGKLTVKWANKKNLDVVLAEKGKKAFFIVTGELGDQLFGSSLMFRENFKDDLDKDWTEVFTPKFVNYWRPLVEENPQQDFSTANVFWWLNFTLKYQWVQLRMFAMLEGKVPLTDFIHFFGGPRFQRWAMSTPMEVKFSDLKDEKTYKMPAKEYIHNFTGDKKDLKNKTKKGSLKDNLDAPIKETVDRITEDMELIRK